MQEMKELSCVGPILTIVKEGQGTPRLLAAELLDMLLEDKDCR